MRGSWPSQLLQLLTLAATGGGFVWLLVVGEWKEVLAGLLIGSLIVPFAFALLSVPARAVLHLLLNRGTAAPRRLVAQVVGFLVALYQLALVATWTMLTFAYYSQPSRHQVAMGLWGFSVSIAPLAVMAARETEPGDSMNMAYSLCPMSYIALAILHWAFHLPMTVELSVVVVMTFIAASIQAILVSQALQREAYGVPG
jgi:hypothetical protein